MTPKKPPEGDFRFRMVGGGLQLQIEDAQALRNVLLLDEAWWAMTEVEVDALRFDRRFLDFLDHDHDGRIRTDEIKRAVEFVLTGFRDLSGVLAGDPAVRMSALDPEAPGMADVLRCGRLILHNLGRDEDGALSADDISLDATVKDYALRNGDGVICADDNMDPEAAGRIAFLVACGFKSTDASGRDGVNMQNILDAEAAIARRLALLDAAAADPSIMPFGAETPAVCALFRKCEPLIDDYFLNAAAGAFLAGQPERAVKSGFSADLMVPGDVRKALESAAAAVPGKGAGLDFRGELNPLYAADLRALAGSPVLAGRLRDGVLVPEEYQAAKAALAPYTKWAEECAVSDGLEHCGEAELRAVGVPGAFDGLKKLTEEDLSLASAVSAWKTLLDLTLCQHFLIELLNNFVSLSELFNIERTSRLQMGKLVMDGRHFTLTVKVRNPAEHKRIVQSSNICVIYVEVMRRDNEKMLLAAAVTSGTMRSLFIGKHGIFFDTDGLIYDAVIRDIAEQPVSIGEAFKSPFFRFADFLGKQTERIFNARNAEMQKNMTTELNKSQLAAVPNAQAKPPASTPQQPAGNLPMLLMGGGIGVAALGSSLAFIAKSLQNVSFTTVLAVLAGIIVIFGGPSVVIALIKLFRRNLSRFLESCGCAVNRPMRMSRKVGNIFTFTPKRPKGRISLLDPADVLRPLHVPKSRSRRNFLIILLTLLLGAVCGVLLTHGVFVMGGGRRGPAAEVRRNCPEKKAAPEVKKAAGEIEKTAAEVRKTAAEVKKPEAVKPAADNVKQVR